MGRNEILSIVYFVCESPFVCTFSSSIIFLKEPSVNPIVGNPLQIVCHNINLLNNVLLLLVVI